MATIKSLSELGNLAQMTRDEVYKLAKATIDAANKRLRRQGVELRLSTKGKDKLQLIEIVKQAINVKPTMANRQPTTQGIRQPKTTTGKPRQSRTLKQLPQNFEKMKRDEFVKQMQPTIDAANKRIKRLQSMKTLSPALNSVMESGGKFSLKGKSRNEVLKEASRAIAFMNMKTSTVSGAKEFEKGFAAKLSNKSKDITNEQRKVLFDTFRKLQQISPVGLNIYGSDRLIRMLADEVTDENYSFESTMQKALNELESEYEQFQMDNDDMNPFDM